MDVKHVVRVSDERAALNAALASGRKLAAYLTASGQQLVDVEYDFIEDMQEYDRIAGKRRDVAQEISANG